MVSISDAVRPYWAKGINSTNINSRLPFSLWLEAGIEYSIQQQIQPTCFVIKTNNRQKFLHPISHDCNRFIVSSFESLFDNEKNKLSDKSIAWDIIKYYYSAFYSAHFIMRVFGNSLSQLDSKVTNRLEKIADVFGNKNGVTINNGFYLCDYSSQNDEVVFNKIDLSDTGSHGALWKLFTEKMSYISNDLISHDKPTTLQKSSIKLSELVKNLKTNSINGNWLSTVRNDVNYKHSYSTWFPYKNQNVNIETIQKVKNTWTQSTNEIELTNHSNQQISKFFATTTFIICMAKEICLDLHQRCPEGKSFIDYGGVHFLNQHKMIKI